MTGCITVPASVLTYNHPASMILIFLAALDSILTLFTIVVFIHYGYCMLCRILLSVVQGTVCSAGYCLSVVQGTVCLLCRVLSVMQGTVCLLCRVLSVLQGTVCLLCRVLSVCCAGYCLSVVQGTVCLVCREGTVCFMWGTICCEGYCLSVSAGYCISAVYINFHKIYIARAI